MAFPNDLELGMKHRRLNKTTFFDEFEYSVRCDLRHAKLYLERSTCAATLGSSRFFEPEKRVRCIIASTFLEYSLSLQCTEISIKAYRRSFKNASFPIFPICCFPVRFPCVDLLKSSQMRSAPSRLGNRLLNY